MQDREYPVLFKRKEDCCSCTACYSICPRNVIDMIVDGEGFEYPKLTRKEDCIKCYQCVRVCPIKEKVKL